MNTVNRVLDLAKEILLLQQSLEATRQELDTLLDPNAENRTAGALSKSRGQVSAKRVKTEEKPQSISAVTVRTKSTVKPKRTRAARGEKTVADKIVELLRASPNALFDAKAIAETLGIANRLKSVQALLSDLRKHGKIAKPETGRYQARKA